MDDLTPGPCSECGQLPTQLAAGCWDHTHAPGCTLDVEPEAQPTRLQLCDLLALDALPADQREAHALDIIRTQREARTSGRFGAGLEDGGPDAA